MSTANLSLGYRRYALAVVTAVYTLNLVDRGLVNILLQPIKEDLQLSDTQMGFVTGIAFAFFYAVAGVPIARWADRGNRATVTAFAIGLWGLTVMVCLWVANYLELLAARIAAAIGESGCKPPTYSLVGDYFAEPTARTRAMSIYWLGGPIATLISFGLGGWLNELYGWRMTFFIMGIPGLVLALIVKLTLVDPRSQRVDQPAETPALPSYRDVFAAMWRQPTSRHLCIALILLYTMGSGLSPWYAAFMIRSHGMGTAELGVWLGVVAGIGGAAGVLLGGYVAVRWFGGNERAQMNVSALAVVVYLPIAVAFLILPDKHAALLTLVPLLISFNFFMGPTYALMQRLVPDSMRATTLAVLMLLVNLIGMGIGPQLVGIMSDLLAPVAGGESLRYAMLVISAITLWSAYHFWRAGKTVRQDLATGPYR